MGVAKALEKFTGARARGLFRIVSLGHILRYAVSQTYLAVARRHREMPDPNGNSSPPVRSVEYEIEQFGFIVL